MSRPHFICLIVHSMLTWVGESPLNSYNFDWTAKISCQQYLSKHHMRVFINLVYMCDMHTRRSFLLAIMLEILLCMGNENNFDHIWHLIHICNEVDIGMVRMSLNGAWMRNWDFLEHFKTSKWSLFIYLFIYVFHYYPSMCIVRIALKGSYEIPRQSVWSSCYGDRAFYWCLYFPANGWLHSLVSIFALSSFYTCIFCIIRSGWLSDFVS